MKKFSILALMAVVTLGITFTSCVSKKVVVSEKPVSSVILASEIDSVSYILGKVNVSQMKKSIEAQLESWPVKGNIEALNAGFLDGMENPDDSLFLGRDMEALDEYIGGFFQGLQQKMSEEQKVEGERFLAENKNKDGVVTTESGLQYKVITEGTGAKPNADNMVKVHYTGKLLDGTVFDSSVERGEPIDLPLSGVIDGWTEGLLLMTVGSKYILWIPSDLAYGESGNQGIKPNSTLEFEVELLEIIEQ